MIPRHTGFGGSFFRFGRLGRFIIVARIPIQYRRILALLSFAE